MLPSSVTERTAPAAIASRDRRHRDSRAPRHHPGRHRRTRDRRYPWRAGRGDREEAAPDHPVGHGGDVHELGAICSGTGGATAGWLCAAMLPSTASSRAPAAPRGTGSPLPRRPQLAGAAELAQEHDRPQREDAEEERAPELHQRAETHGAEHLGDAGGVPEGGGDEPADPGEFEEARDDPPRTGFRGPPVARSPRRRAPRARPDRRRGRPGHMGVGPEGRVADGVGALRQPRRERRRDAAGLRGVPPPRSRGDAPPVGVDDVEVAGVNQLDRLAERQGDACRRGGRRGVGGGIRADQVGVTRRAPGGREEGSDQNRHGDQHAHGAGPAVRPSG